MSRYITLLNDDIVWQSRKEYLQILKLFISRRISVEEFIQQYGQMRRLNFEALKRRQKNLEDKALVILPKVSEIGFQLNPQSSGFSKILSSIDNGIDLFGYGISEEFLILGLKDNFLPRISEYCKKSKISYSQPT